ncbi:MAG: TetR family transcriptional regulator [Chloroflexi bacterium]|nr:TetR family transcriptional regulator [Chloroflexota bacterium]
MESTPVNAEQRIIDATVECIEKYGVKGATNRRIAAEAGVNIAAINYYFRSKEALIDRCMQITLDNAFGWNDFAYLANSSPRDTCIGIFDHLIEGGGNFPGITRAHFYDLIVKGFENSAVIGKMNAFAAHLSDDLEAKGVGLEKSELNLACMQIISAALMVILAPKLFEEKFGFDLHVAADRKRYVERLVDRLLSPCP